MSRFNALILHSVSMLVQEYLWKCFDSLLLIVLPTSGPTPSDLEGDLNMMLAALKSFTEHVPLAGHFLMQLQADLNGLENVISVRPYDVTVGYQECHVHIPLSTTINILDLPSDHSSSWSS